MGFIIAFSYICVIVLVFHLCIIIFLLVDFVSKTLCYWNSLKDCKSVRPSCTFQLMEGRGRRMVSSLTALDKPGLYNNTLF